MSVKRDNHNLRRNLKTNGNAIETATSDDHDVLKTPSLTIIKQDDKPPGFEKQRLWKSMFSICVENSSNNGYHTEKVIDAFLSKTIPVYWGCPNLEELGYDPEGFIYCTNEDEIIEKVNKLTPETYYSKKEAIEHNFEVAKHYANVFERFAELLKEIVNLNQI